MYTFKVTDSKGNIHVFSGINKVIIEDLSNDITLEGEEIFLYHYPTNTGLYLYSDTSAYVIDSEAISVLEVSKES